MSGKTSASGGRGPALLVLGTSLAVGVNYGILLAIALRSWTTLPTTILGSLVFGAVSLLLWRTVFPALAGRRRAWLPQLAVAVVVMTAVSFATVAGSMYFGSGRSIFESYTGPARHLTVSPQAINAVPAFLVMLPILPAALMTVLGFHLAWSRIARSEAREQKAHELASLAQLQALRAQINPHFLFNSLNSIIQLIHRDPDLAERNLHRMVEVFRYVLRSEDRKLVTLRDELEIADAYLDIERARFGDRLSVAIQVEDEAREHLVPALILQPLVENAVKHGVGSRTEGGLVEIRAAIREQSLQLVVRDTGLGIGESAEESGAGVGLRNVCERMAHLYGVDYAPRIDTRAGEGTRITLTVPPRFPEEMGAPS